MDIAVNLVESYLRLNGYLTLSEFEIQGRGKDGVYRTLTDVDIVGLRFPGDIYAADSHDVKRVACCSFRIRPSTSNLIRLM